MDSTEYDVLWRMINIDLQMPQLWLIWRDDEDDEHYENDDLQWQWGEMSMMVYDNDKTTSGMEDWQRNINEPMATENQNDDRTKPNGMPPCHHIIDFIASQCLQQLKQYQQDYSCTPGFILHLCKN